jgi:hypothetical protein
MSAMQRRAYWPIGLIGSPAVVVGVGVAAYGVVLVTDPSNEPTASTEADVIQCINKNSSAPRSARLAAELVSDRCRRKYETDVTAEVKLKGDLGY